MEDQNFLIWVFLGRNSRKIRVFEKATRNVVFYISTLIEYFMLEFQITNDVFEISILEFVDMQI